MLLISSCFKSKDKVIIKDNSKVLATVNGKSITQLNVDIARKTSTFSEKEMIEKIIDDELLLTMADKLKVNASDDEAESEMKKQRSLIEKADNKSEIKETINDIIKQLGITEEEYWNSYVIGGYKRALIIGKVRKKLGAETDKTLKQLREKADIKYYD